MAGSDAEKVAERRDATDTENGAEARRHFLRLALLGGAAAGVGLATQSRTALAGHDVSNVFHLGEVNTFGRGILSVNVSQAGLDVMNAGGIGVFADGRDVGVRANATSPTGFGVHGTGVSGVKGMGINVGVEGSGQSVGVVGHGSAAGGTGVIGVGDFNGVRGNAIGPTLVGAAGTGVEGIAHETSGLTRGVVGESRSPEGTGVRGFANSLTGPTVGVQGESNSPAGIGVAAVNGSGGFGLRVIGRSRFSTGGLATIPAGPSNQHFQVNDVNVGPSTFISVTLNSNPGQAAVRWIERVPGVGFIIHLSKPPTVAIQTTYWLAETT